MTLKCDEPLSTFAFNFNLGRYMLDDAAELLGDDPDSQAPVGVAGEAGGVFRTTTRTQILARVTFRVNARTARSCLAFHSFDVRQVFVPSNPGGGQGLTLVHFSSQPEPFQSLTDCRYPTYPTKCAYVELK